MASLTEDPGKRGKTYPIPLPQNQLCMPGVLEFAVVGVAAAWIGCFRSPNHLET